MRSRCDQIYYCWWRLSEHLSLFLNQRKTYSGEPVEKTQTAQRYKKNAFDLAKGTAEGQGDEDPDAVSLADHGVMV